MAIIPAVADPATFLRTLAETPQRIEAACSQLSADELRVSATPGGWSPNEILWHIRATADVHGEHIARILEEDTPRWRHVSPRARMKKARYDELPFAESFAAFREQRAALVVRLEGLSAESWQRFAVVRVPHRNADWRLKLEALVSGMAQHENGHCDQIEAAVAALRPAI
jgi:hypothetical protein